MIITALLLLLGILIVQRRQYAMTEELKKYFATNRQAVEGLNTIIANQHILIQKLLTDRVALQEKMDEVAELLPPQPLKAEWHYEDIARKTDHDNAAIVMFQKLEDAKKLINSKLNPDSLLAKELKEILG